MSVLTLGWWSCEGEWLVRDFLAAKVWKGNRRKDAIEVRRERKGGRTH
jgi:hypothetical protein